MLNVATGDGDVTRSAALLMALQEGSLMGRTSIQVAEPSLPSVRPSTLLEPL